MRSEPERYGQKFLMAANKNENSAINEFSYLVKNDDRRKHECLGDWVLENFMDPYINNVRNVTCYYNFFSSLSPANYMS